MLDARGAIEKLPNEILLGILKCLYPPAVFQPFDLELICLDDSVWHDRLLNAHLDMLSVSMVSRLFNALSITIAQSHAQLIIEERKDAVFLHAMCEAGLSHFRRRMMDQIGRPGPRPFSYFLGIEGILSQQKDLEAHIREYAKRFAAEEKAERFDPLSWLDIGHSHTRRAVRCGRIMSNGVERSGVFVNHSQKSRFGASRYERFDHLWKIME